MMAIRAPSIQVERRLLVTPAICAAFVLAGVIAVLQPLVGLGVLAVAFLAWRAERLEKDAFMVLLLGNVVLTYGFANLGLHAGLPIPATELLLLPLVGWCVLNSRYLERLGLPLVLLAAMLTVATVRLIVDFQNFGNLAIRDYVTPLEHLALIAGFWMFNKYGLQWSSNAWKVTFIAAIIYCLTYPWGPTVAELGPVVGLQKSIPLLGQYHGSGPAIATAFFFCLLVVRRPWSFVLAAFALGIMALFQARGLYLVLPMATVLILFTAGKLNTGLVPKIAAAMTVAAVLLVLVTPFGLKGRMGPLTASFATEQLGTLLGKKGAGDGSREDRLTWARYSIEDMSATPAKTLFGVGLGYDLTHGAKFNGEEAIRKPHNDFLEVLARFGFVGFSLWVAFLASVILPVWRTARFGYLTKDERTFMLWIVAGVLCYLFIATNQPLLAFPYGTIPLFTMLGMALALSRQAATRTTIPEEHS